MKFRGMPSDMRIGCIDVRPVSKLTLPLLPCGFCKFFNCEYFTCVQGHVTCIECGTDELHQASADRFESSCFGCGSRVPLRRTRIIASNLRHEKFVCPCGFLGTLGEIKKHLEAPGNELRDCVLSGKTREEMDVFGFKRTLLDVQNFRETVDKLDGHLASFFDVRLAKPNHLLHDHFENSDYTFGLEEKVKTIDELATEVARLNNEMRPAMEMLFRGDSWLIVKREKLFMPEPFNVAINGIPLRVCFKETRVNDAVWLGFFMRGSAHKAPPDCTLRSDVFPLKSKVTVRVHDTKGHEFRSAVLRTFANGSYTSLSFKDPKTERAIFVGVTKLILVEDIGPKTVKNGQVHLSMRFDPIYND